MPRVLERREPIVVERPLRVTENPYAYLREDDSTARVADLGARSWRIVDVHEHIGSQAQVKGLLRAMDRFGIERACLIASSTYTLTLDRRYGFVGFEENNELIISLKRKWPSRFAAFITIDPAGGDNLARVQQYVARGADGLKLYMGHGGTVGAGEPFHSMALTDPRMDALWSWAERVQLPIVLHVNLIMFWDEMVELMERHPYLRINMPHLGLHKNSAARLARLGFLLDRYPYLFSDISFGIEEFQIEGFEALAKWRSRSREFLTRYRHKLMFGADMVLDKGKDKEYVENTLRSYRQFLEQRQFRFFLMPHYTMHGMDLDDESLEWLYERAPASWLLLDSEGRLPDRTRGWPPDGVAPVRRPVITPIDSVHIPRADRGPGTDPNSEAPIGSFQR